MNLSNVYAVYLIGAVMGGLLVIILSTAYKQYGVCKLKSEKKEPVETPTKRKRRVSKKGKLTILRRDGKVISFDSVTKAGKFLNRGQSYVCYLDRTKKAEPHTGYKVQIVRK